MVRLRDMVRLGQTHWFEIFSDIYGGTRSSIYSVSYLLFKDEQEISCRDWECFAEEVLYKFS